jgi:hypothetical protein
VNLLRGMRPTDFARIVKHPEMVIALDTLLALYAWHGRHHTARHFVAPAHGLG